MNNNSSFLKLFNSTSSLSEFEVDILYVFIIPILSIICLLFKIISIHVLRLLIQTKENNTLTTNNNSFKRVHFYMITFESSDLFIALIFIFTSIFRCGNYCKLGYDHTTKVFELIFYDLIGGTVLQLEIFLELAIAIERLQSFSVNYKQPTMKFKFKLIIILVAAIIVPLPNYVLTKTIMPVGILNNETYLYSIKTNHFVQNNKYWTIGLFVYGLLRSSLIYIILLVLNVIIIVKYKYYINKKLKLLLLRQGIITANIKNNNDPKVEIMNKTRRHLREKDSTDLLIAMSINFLVGNLPLSCAPIVFMCVGSSRPLIYNYYFIITMIMCILSHMIYLFLFYNYNNAFKMS